MPSLEGGLERLFVGVPVPELARVALSRQIPSFIPGKPSPLENWHFTLRFLGGTDSARRALLVGRMHATNFGSSFDIELDQLGAFPSPRRARVVWIGVGRGREALEQLADKVEVAARESGFEAEPRKFSAHLTIARIKQPQSIDQLLSRAQKVNATMQVNDVILYRSEMGREHSRYSVVAAFPLNQRRSS